MNKIIYASLLILLSFSLSAQKVIERPSFNGTTANYLKILKIELTDTATAIDFRIHFQPGNWISIPKETCIREDNSGKMLYIKSAKGIEIGTQHIMPESGVDEYTLYFPPVGEDVKLIDYLENQWKIYGIELDRTEKFSIFPEPLLGSWLRTDGSNEWVYGFYEGGVVYDSDIWKQVLISQKDDLYEVVLQKEGKRKKLIVKQQDDLMLIGADSNNLESFSRETTDNPDYVIANDEEFQLPVFKKDTAVYCGYIKGYHPDMGKTGMIYVNNIISSDQESYLIAINPDGSFATRFPMIYPQQVFVRMLNYNEAVYCEPGKTTFQLNDFSKYHDEGGPNLLFMGPTARINQDLMAMNRIRFYNYQDMQQKILDLSPEDYKSYFLDIKNRELEAVNEFAQAHAVSRKALQIKKMQISFSAGQNILSYSYDRESAYRIKHQVPREQREIPLEQVHLTKEFYDFIDAGEMNNPLSLVAGSEYYILINRVKYSDPVSQSGALSVSDMEAISTGFKGSGIKLEPRENDLIEKFSRCESEEERFKVFEQHSAEYNDFCKKYEDVLSDIRTEILMKKREDSMQKGLKEYFNLEQGFAIDIMKIQDRSGSFRSSYKPLSEYQKNKVKNEIQNDFIITYLFEQSTELEKEIAIKQKSFQNKSGFVVNETPTVTEGDLFDTLIKKYRGKVVFVDFWATWCGPCRAGIEQMKPLKEELKNRDMVFVYITNPTSPQKTWELFIPDIHGEHYYLTQDEWNTMAARFKVSGIPHYVLVDKKGKVVQDKIYFASANSELKRLFEEQLKN